MKKLKKVLSLVLVLAMAVSMFGVVASAKDINEYPDVDKITYTEAVGVLSGLGVLEGDEDGFRPTDTLTRAEAAKIVDYLMGLQDNNVEEGTKFTDIVGHWAEGYITIAESVGLINGNGDGTYAPEGVLTGYAWEKMCLSALGYDAKIEGMLGDKWEGGVLVLSDKLDLRADLASTYDATKAITREEAAQIAFNALNEYTVTYKVNGYSYTQAKKDDTTLGQKIFGLTKGISFDVFGAPVARVYTNGEKGPKEVVYASFAYTPVASYSNIGKGTKFEEIYDDIADASKAPVKKTDLIAYEDGVELGTPVDAASIGGRGVQVDVYEVEPGEYRVIEINTYVKEIAASDIAKAQVNTNGTVVKESYIKNLAKGAYLATGDFEEKDVIIYNVGNMKNVDPNKDQVVAANAQARAAERGVASTVSYNGVLSNITKNDGYVCIDKGEKTYFNVNAAGVKKVLTTDYYAFYYDTYGNVIYVAPAKYDTVSEVGHLYVIDAISYYDENHSIENGDAYHPVITRDVAAQALVVEYTDTEAEIKVVDLAIGQGPDGYYYLLDEHGFLTTKKINWGVNHNWSSNLDVPNDEFAEYYVTEDGEYIIVDCEDAVDNLTTERGKTNIKKDGSFYRDATTSTKISYLDISYDPVEITPETIADMASKGTATVKTVVGYKNFEDATTTKAAYLEKDERTGKATVGAMLNIQATATTTLYAAFIGTEYLDEIDGYAYNFVDSYGEKYTLCTENWEGTEWNSATNPKPEGNGWVTAMNPVGTKEFDNDMDKGKVYKLALNSENKIVAYNELENTVPANGVETDDDDVYYGYAKYVDPTGYIELNTKPTEELEFAPGFGEVPYTGAAPMTLADAVRDNKWVAVYTDKVEDGPGPKVEKVVFVSVVEDPNKKGTIEATYVKGSGFKYGDTYINGVNCFFKDGTAMTSVVDELDELDLFDGKKFDITFVTTADINNDTVTVYGDATAKDADFYVYNGNDKLFYVSENEVTSTDIAHDGATDENAIKGWTYCSHSLTLLKMDQAGNVVAVTQAQYDADTADTHFVVVGYHADETTSCGLVDVVIYSIEP